MVNKFDGIKFKTNTYKPVINYRKNFYLLKIRLKIKNFKPVFLDTGSFFWKFFDVVQIRTETVLI